MPRKTARVAVVIALTWASPMNLAHANPLKEACSRASAVLKCIAGKIVYCVDRARVRLAAYEVKRDARTYAFDYGPALFDELNRLSANDVVYDLGCGQCVAAREIFLDVYERPPMWFKVEEVAPRPDLGQYAITRKTNYFTAEIYQAIGRFLARDPSQRPRFRGLSFHPTPSDLPNDDHFGTVVGDFDAPRGDPSGIPLEDMPAGSLYIDHDGILSYTGDLSGSINRVLDHAAVGAAILIVESQVGSSAHGKTWVKTKAGKSLPLDEWLLGAVTGAEVTRLTFDTLTTGWNEAASPLARVDLSTLRPELSSAKAVLIRKTAQGAAVKRTKLSGGVPNPVTLPALIWRTFEEID